ncbi:hypothetical protein FHT26_005106 [Rhizobacter sp. SG703]|nr:hypothetical protein [Rhizobacter sp. SG703]
MFARASLNSPGLMNPLLELQRVSRKSPERHQSALKDKAP